MKIIKLDAIESTNSFLKGLKKNSGVNNFTVVVAKNQTNGKGQRNNNWVAEPYKNLTFSILYTPINLCLEHIKYLNFSISLAIFRSLNDIEIPEISIKWPNDIMSCDKKICGILIENSLKNNLIDYSIIGIGLNVNQTQFPKDLPHVSSLKGITNKEYDLDDLLNKTLTNIKFYLEELNSKKFKVLEEEYLSNLYKKDMTTLFKNKNQEKFLGIIRGVSNSGNLLIEIEDKTIKEFGLKEVTMLS